MKLNPQTCVQLFDMALNQTGFTVMHSYLMFKEDPQLLQISYDIMEASKRYSTKQLEYVSTMLIIKPIHDHLMKEGGLVSDYDDDDKKRYTQVIIESESDDPLLKFACIQFSANGLRTGGGKMKDKLPPDHDKIISRLSEGDHLIRYMSKPYFDRYSEDTWVPVYLRNGELFAPDTGSE